MLYFFRLLLILINIDQETVLKWFGLEDPNITLFSQVVEIEPSSALSLETIKLIIEGLWDKIQDGLTLADLENVLLFILFIRFVILAIRYNLKTSFYITSIGLLAAYLWYRHLIDLISMYRNVLISLPFLHKLGLDIVQLRSLHRQMVITDFRLGEDVHWYSPFQLIYYAFTKGIIELDPETGTRYYIDPISMLISNLNESQQSKILPAYYKIYNGIIPKVFQTCSKFWTQLSGIAAYAVITRIGKRYCPYLIRWHWTFLLMMGMVESILIYLIYRLYYFQSFVLIPEAEKYLQYNYVDSNVLLQIEALNGLTAAIVLAHMGLVFFGMFHAIWGQYFYIPFFVENTELHIGPRPKNSIYSGGNTAWQDEKEENIKRVVPKVWYGWFGRGTKNGWQGKISRVFKKFLRKLLKKLKKRFRK